MIPLQSHRFHRFFMDSIKTHQLIPIKSLRFSKHIADCMHDNSIIVLLIPLTSYQFNENHIDSNRIQLVHQNLAESMQI